MAGQDGVQMGGGVVFEVVVVNIPALIDHLQIWRGLVSVWLKLGQPAC